MTQHLNIGIENYPLKLTCQGEEMSEKYEVCTICYEMFSSILGWSWQRYVALEFCSVLHITYYTFIQQLDCIPTQVLPGCSPPQDSRLQANKCY